MNNIDKQSELQENNPNLTSMNGNKGGNTSDGADAEI